MACQQTHRTPHDAAAGGVASARTAPIGAEALAQLISTTALMPLARVRLLALMCLVDVEALQEEGRTDSGWQWQYLGWAPVPQSQHAGATRTEDGWQPCAASVSMLGNAVGVRRPASRSRLVRELLKKLRVSRDLNTSKRRAQERVEAVWLQHGQDPLTALVEHACHAFDMMQALEAKGRRAS